MLRTHTISILALSISAVFAGSALAQVDTGAIAGIVTDSTGAIVPGAKVTITQTDTNVHVVMETNNAGFYSAPALHAGPYEVEVSKQGFQAQKRTGVSLRVQDRLELNFTLTLGSTKTEIT